MPFGGTYDLCTSELDDSADSVAKVKLETQPDHAAL